MENLEQFLAGLSEINPNIDAALIERAYRKAEEMHEGQFRKSGEPYLVHPIEVAKILAHLGMDETTIVAGLLHDAVEDTPYSQEEITRDFGKDVALLVDGVTKLGSLVTEGKEERQAENLRKMFLAMSKDIRVLLIKLADRLHNLRTINYMNHDQIMYKCRETLEIYAPLCGRLGIFAMKFELEDIALKHLDPEAYFELANQVKMKKIEREESIGRVIGEIKQSLDELKIAYEITGRSKHFYSIYRKMKYQHKQLEEIFDLTAVRIIVETVRDCYAALGAVHAMWKPLPGRFKDYIAMPKPNLYQSLHTTVLSDKGNPFEIQIRTRSMHRIAEYGIAAHWKYKEGLGASAAGQEEVKLAWLRQTMEWQKDMNDPREFMETLKMDLFSNQVFVFTPKGDVIELPAGSTPLDFAFKIHSGVGVKCVGAKVNGKMVPIDYSLKNGEIIEIITSSNSKGPGVDWLRIAKTSNARSKIRQWLKRENRGESAERGRDLLERAVKRKGFEPQTILRAQWLQRVSKQLNYASPDEMYGAVSHGGVVLSKVVNALAEICDEETQTAAKRVLREKERADAAYARKQSEIAHRKRTDVRVKGVRNLLIHLGRCCNPVPGDEITGFITKGKGVTVHRADCPNIIHIPEEEKGRLIEVEWEYDELDRDRSYDSDVAISADDRKGLLSDISRVCEDMDVHITGVNAKSGNDGAVYIIMTLSISNTSQMEKILLSLRGVAGVEDAHRATG
ncbi:MAG: bifunctional (p)ppGpp synthetase/guanosine-3',5'-bis(diphosphate) 3'-pyrophosphohydrolase [Clostridiales Family XIII bacterium]|jgi:GTP pyrophosphokinase|nr:bifunctional (p)ppGpp synthetase/guanosine-3',5'-bis(diphosphate) 3'-pyrophosphohydrolase [Clostridiales Family XIII bacterium]